MGGHPAPSPVDVRGGSHGIDVDEEQLRRVAAAFGAAGHDCGSSAVGLHAYLVDPDIGTSALFDPAGYAGFAAALTAALDGPLGLAWAGARCGLADASLRAAAVAYDTTETVIEKAQQELELPLALGYFSARYARTGDLSLSIQNTITTYPDVADDVIDDLGLRRYIADAAHGLPDGHGVAVSTGVDPSADATRPPRDLADVVTALGARDDDAHHGAVDIRILTRADHSRAVIVDISGTKSWTPLPTSDITSLVTNGRALLGEQTSYEHGVLTAMHNAGVTKSDDVMIVGHSQGGMVAVNAARDAVNSGDYNVTHVITAGSPIGLSVGSMPKQVNVLALEGNNDLVPHLDGATNPDRANVTTVTGRHGNGTISDDHGTADGYIPLARDTDASTDASVRDYLHSCRRYFDAASVQTRTYQIVRHY